METTNTPKQPTLDVEISRCENIIGTIRTVLFGKETSPGPLKDSSNLVDSLTSRMSAINNDLNLISEVINQIK
jgi:hypothetical protein